MRIGIDARMYNESGIGRYIRNLIGYLQKLDKENIYYIFLLEENFRELNFNKNFKKVLANFHWYGLSEQIRFPNLLNNYNLDLVHFPHFNVPIFYKDKFVVTIHDLIHQHFQMRRVTTRDPIIYKVKQLGYNQIFKAAIAKSQKILVPSNFVKNQLINEWRVGDKVVVTPEAVEEQLIAIATHCTPEKIKSVLDKFKIRPRFLFYIGNAHPHKNVEGLINAFLNIRKDYQYLQLVLSGNDHYFWQKIRKEYADKNIIYTGFVSDEELVALYKGAQCFVMPSYEEGFGIPILEAMTCGTAVVCSDAGSLKEVGGDAALYFNPKDISDMEEKIVKVLDDQKLRKQLIEKGEKRYKLFSWENLAESTSNVYREVI